MSAQEIALTANRIIAQGVMSPHDIVVGTRFRRNNELDEDFLESIREKGILQPVTIDQDRKLVAGGRRTAAALQLGIEIPFIQRHTEGELDLRECELIENAFRKDFNWIDRNNLVNRIHALMEERHGNNWSQRKTADLLNKSVGGINRHLALSKAIGHFPQLAQCKTEDEAVKLFRRLGERIVVKDLAKQTAARSTLGEAAPKSDDTPQPEVEAPLGIKLASSAIHHYRVGDSFAGMEEIASQNRVVNISLVEIDPPYAIDLVNQKKGDLNKGIGEYNEVDGDKYRDFLHRTISLTNKITPKDCRFIIWFGIEWYQTLIEILAAEGMKYDIIPGIWSKPTGQTAAPDLYLARSYETFIIAWKGNATPLRARGRANVFNFTPEPHGQKYHPTQRPIALMEELLLTFAWPGSLVLVPFLGSGTTLRAAYRCGMMGFGWDLSEVYKEGFLAAIERDIQGGELDAVLGVEDELEDK